MAKRGAKAIPFKVHQIRGTVQKIRHGTEKDQAVVSSKAPVCSKYLPLGEVGRTEWRRVMRAAGTIKPQELDRAMLALYCWYWDRFINDADSMKAADVTQMRLCAVELGFSRSARQSLRGKD